MASATVTTATIDPADGAQFPLNPFASSEVEKRSPGQAFLDFARNERLWG